MLDFLEINGGYRSALISDDPHKKSMIGHYRYGQNHFLFLEEIVDESWETVTYDILLIKPKGDQMIIYLWCREDGKVNKEIIALVKGQREKEYFDEVIIAWRANPLLMQFQEISPKNIDCENLDYGL